MSRYQKGKTNLDFTEARDSEWQWHQLGHMQVCTSLQTDNHASTPPLSFLQAGCPSCRPTNSVKALDQPEVRYHSDALFPKNVDLNGRDFLVHNGCKEFVNLNSGSTVSNPPSTFFLFMFYPLCSLCSTVCSCKSCCTSHKQGAYSVIISL